MTDNQKSNGEKPWLVDKRSWIFYISEIRKNKKMICGETENNLYFLDCETAHLSI